MLEFFFNISNNLLGISNGWNAIKDALAWFLNILYQFTDIVNLPSYALAIVLFTIVIKLALYPLTLKQMRSMRGMQKIQPLIMEINQKYENDPQKKNEETFRIYREYDINPLSGCLPLLIQMPILIALYRTIYSFVPPEGVNYSFFWIDSLSLPDPTGWILPVIVGLATFLQQKMSTVDSSNPSQKMMLYFMPIFFGFISRNFPAALSLYWISFSVLGGVQQIMVNRKCAKEELLAEEKLEQEALLDPKKRHQKEHRKLSELDRAVAAAQAEKEKKAKEKAAKRGKEGKDNKDKGQEVKTKLTQNEIFDGDHPWSKRSDDETGGYISTPDGSVRIDEGASAAKTNKPLPESKPLSEEMRSKVKKGSKKRQLRRKK
ncbi:MAG: YidC/Oxa1 family membrane protein insertase [Bacillota bacterium]|jgi:YidC/Oxa1 family membrane protein insertase